MLLLALIGCGGGLAGTWLFTLAYTEPTGEECVTTPTSNYTGAYPPPVAAEDTAWTQSQSLEYSSQLYFGRIEETETGAALVFGTTVLPGTKGEGDEWTFGWSKATTGETRYSHVTGYTFVRSYEQDAQVTLSGTFTKGTFTGSYDTESASTDGYSESDYWSDEAAAYVGTTGLTPVGSYLLKLDGTGVEVAATNTQAEYECSSDTCTLTVQSGCAYSYDLSAVATEFAPDDARWVQDAGQAAGY